jgi:hypothetical protein
MEELLTDLDVAENFTPLDGPERLSLFREVMSLVRPENMQWKAADWDRPTEWKPRDDPGSSTLLSSLMPTEVTTQKSL